MTPKNLTFARTEYKKINFVPCKNGAAMILFRMYPILGETYSFHLQDEIISWKQEAK